jgi:soluble P-type ATPase
LNYIKITAPGLSIEQQFEVAKIKEQIKQCSLEQLQELFVDVYSASLKKDAFIKSLLAEKLGIDAEDLHR